MIKFKISRLRLRKIKELIAIALCNGTRNFIIRDNMVRYSTNLFGLIFKPKYTTLPEFCTTIIPTTFDVTVNNGDTIDRIIDKAYSNYILGEYNLSSTGAYHKFQTIRNLFKNCFMTDDFVIEDYATRMSLPVMKIIKDNSIGSINLAIANPVHKKLITIVRKIGKSTRDHIMREADLVRAGPGNIEFQTLVA